jgi:hypothetical protein
MVISWNWSQVPSDNFTGADRGLGMNEAKKRTQTARTINNGIRNRFTRYGEFPRLSCFDTSRKFARRQMRGLSRAVTKSERHGSSLGGMRPSKRLRERSDIAGRSPHPAVSEIFRQRESRQDEQDLANDSVLALGGTGNLPVSAGYQPGEFRGNLRSPFGERI